MTQPFHHIAQVNIARARAALEDPIMAGFVSLLDEINTLADRSARAFTFKRPFSPALGEKLLEL